jgi:hypothetical protein
MSTMRLWGATLPLLAGLILGCENPRPALTAVEPAWAYSDSDIRLALLGSDFVPTTVLDPLSGRRIANSDGFRVRIGKGEQWAELPDLDWQSTGAMTVSLPSTTARHLPAGLLDIEVVDPRGRDATRADAFLELGPDGSSPTVTFQRPSPNSLYAAGMVLGGSFHASDAPLGGLAGLGWTYLENEVTLASASCHVVAGTPEADCDFQVTISQTLGEGDQVQIVADATDTSASGNRAQATLSITLRGRPSVTSIAPDHGGMAGGTDVVIRGAGFLPGSQATIGGDLLFPDGGVVIDENTLSGHVPAHDDGPALLMVRTPLGDTTGTVLFSYLPPPLIAAIAPDSGAAAGGTAVTITGTNFSADTRVYFGASLDSAVPLDDLFLQNDTSIIGHTPPGSGQTTVFAFDPSLGFTKLPRSFTWRTP